MAAGLENLCSIQLSYGTLAFLEDANLKKKNYFNNENPFIASKSNITKLSFGFRSLIKKAEVIFCLFKFI